MVEFGFLEKVEQRPEVVVRLARKSDHHRRAEREIGDRIPEPLDLRAKCPGPFRAAHALKHRVRGVLNRHVYVGQKSRLRGHQFDQRIAETGGVDVQQSEPRNHRLVEQPTRQGGDIGSVAPLPPVVSQVLRHEVQLDRTLCLEARGLRDYGIESEGPVLAPP